MEFDKETNTLKWSVDEEEGLYEYKISYKKIGSDEEVMLYFIN